MNIFFYPTSVSKHSKPYFEALQSYIVAKNLVLLPGGSGLISRPCLNLRCGDILILYAENDDGINSLLTMQNDLKDFRILLILNPEISPSHQDSAYALGPIFVAAPAEFTKLSTVITNILAHNDDQKWSLELPKNSSRSLRVLS